MVLGLVVTVLSMVFVVELFHRENGFLGRVLMIYDIAV